MPEREAPDLVAGGALDVKERPTPAPVQDAGFDSIVRSAVGDLQKDSAATKRTLDANQAKSTNILTRLEASEKDRPVAPEIEKPEPPPKQQSPTSAFDAFGSAASVLAIFGSLASRRPLTTALNASAAAMKAIHERDNEGFERNYKEWKAHSEYAGQIAEWQLQRYQQTLDGWKGTQEGLFGQLRAISALDQDTLAKHAMQTGDLQVVEKFLADRQAQVERYQQHQLELDRLSETHRHNVKMEDRPVGGARAGEIKVLSELVQKKEDELGRPLTSDEYLEAQRAASISFQNASRRDDTTRRGQDIHKEQGDRRLDLTEEKVRDDKLYKDELLKFNGDKEKALEAYRNRALEVREKVSGVKREQAVKQTDSLLAQADDLLTMIDKNPSIVGTRGKIGGAFETVKGLINPRATTDPAFQRFETAMKAFRTEASLAISQSKYYSGARMAEMAKTLPALENFTSAQDATAAITTMRGLLQGAKLEVGEAPKADIGTITQADIETTARDNGIPVDAVKRMLREKGFDVP